MENSLVLTSMEQQTMLRSTSPTLSSSRLNLAAEEITNEGYLMGFDNVGEGPHCRDCIKSGNKNGECNDNHHWVSVSSVSE